MKNTMLFCGFTLMTIVMFQSCTKDELSNLNTVSSPQEMTFIAVRGFSLDDNRKKRYNNLVQINQPAGFKKGTSNDS
jgi:hypothetical protein